MKNILDVLSEKHSTWVKYIISFGCKKDIAEDFVQEMYIKIYDYSKRKDNDLMYNENEINYFFIYVTLKNMYYDNLRGKKKLSIVDLEKIDIEYDDDYNEIKFNTESKKLSKWIENMDKRINEIQDYTLEKSTLLYIKFIYDKVFVENKSVSQLSRDAGISYWSLRNTVQTIKEQVKNEI